MRAHHGNLHSADVVAVFESQDDADEAILQLRVSGFKDNQIGYFAWHPIAGLTNLFDRSYAGVGVVVGGIAGALLGIAAARVLNAWSLSIRDVSDFFGLAVTCAVFMSLFAGLIGWGIGVGIHRSRVEMPAIDPAVGPFILAVSAGGAREWAWRIIHRNGGHELPPGAIVASPSAV